MKDLSMNLLSKNITWMRKYVHQHNKTHLIYQATFPHTDVDIILPSHGT